MPAILESQENESSGPATLPFPPVTKSHILHCSYHYWHPKYRTITPKARLIPLTQPFLDYLRADGIVLPSDDEPQQRTEWSDTDSGVFSASDNPDADESDEEAEEDVAAEWRQVHLAIRNTIAELGGRVMPKLNWSAPKDATWINANTMDCRTPQDIYMLLKSSDFVTHDLEHAFQDCVDSPDSTLQMQDIPYHLALRKTVPNYNPSVEFRCFVRERKLLCLCQRDLNHFDFLFHMQHRLRSLVKEFFEVRLRDTFPEPSFVFDVYVPQPYDRVWLVDFNPWAPRTDPLLFSWMELLRMPAPLEPEPIGEADFVRISLNGPKPAAGAEPLGPEEEHLEEDPEGPNDDDDDDDEEADEEADEELSMPELRLVKATDPEAYSFSTPQYSAHKLPKDVVDASQSGEGLREFARDWQKILEQRIRQDVSDSEDD
ncbi:related to Cell division cycle 123 [Lecanosticta acicola]|uniref:Related to Cell division cycle 123 n=1 Tax=Lecanosticta acicola TaxID=111012 RepID=A0AAI8Z7R5_9PEZI|nr:related to Cell division cycle 123 [Lecanosticta acicola]